MCIIAAIPERVNVQKQTLQRCWQNNPHGGGYMFTDGDKIVIRKFMQSFKKLWKQYCADRRAFPNSKFVVHFRISTHGKVNEDNCHPFLVNTKLGFAHNGVIRNAPIDDNYSDTVMFNETILKELPENFLQSAALRTLIKDFIGYGSKLCFLNANNEFTIINEQAGEWNEGIWWSNGGFRYVNYFDYGGKKIDAAPKLGTSFKTKQAKPQQSTLGFASAVFPQISSESAAYNQSKIDARIEELEQRIKKQNKSIHSNLQDNYNEPCCFCGDNLSSYKEKLEGFCYKCEDKYTLEWSL